MMLHVLDNYDQVRIFTYKLLERPNISRRFISGSLILFIEDYDDCVKVKNYVLQNSRLRNYEMLFKHQIRLSKSKEQALRIIKEARAYGLEIPEELANKFDSMWCIIEKQINWRKNISIDWYERFHDLYDKFCRMKSIYFDILSLQQLKEISLEQHEDVENSRMVSQTSSFTRSVFIKEYARRVAQGICQLCNKEAPFNDKQGKPFLEVHHIHYLSKGGSDTIDNVVALCPNCHRRIHQLELKEDTEKINEKALVNFHI